MLPIITMNNNTKNFLKNLNDSEWNKIISPINQNCKLFINETSLQICTDIPPNVINSSKQVFICDFVIGDTPSSIKNKI